MQWNRLMQCVLSISIIRISRLKVHCLPALTNSRECELTLTKFVPFLLRDVEKI